jgi:hypothetical protein
MAMLDTLRREYAQLVTSGAQLLLLFVAARFNTHTGWLICFGMTAFISLFAWMSALHRLRVVRDTPTSRIASAAQGYVELFGRGKLVPDKPLLSKLTGLPCLWYRYKIERRGSKNEWIHHENDESNGFFMLEDETGSCVIDPSGAEILTHHKETWIKSDYRYTEWLLLHLDSIYTIGHFRTFGGSSVELDVNEEVKNVLAEWKQNMPELRKRFDLNNDGELDMQEWMLARQAAKREATKRMAVERAEPDVNYLIQPSDGRLFMISNIPQEKLERRYWFWVWAHLMIFFGSLGGLGWLLSHKVAWLN